jgi:hypothetical protein
MKKTSENETKKTISSKVEELEAQIAFAEAGELYSHKQQKSKKKKGTDEKHVCVEGETSSGLCTECS